MVSPYWGWEAAGVREKPLPSQPYQGPGVFKAPTELLSSTVNLPLTLWAILPGMHGYLPCWVGSVFVSLPVGPETVMWGFSFLLHGFMFEIESRLTGHQVPGMLA